MRAALIRPGSLRMVYGLLLLWACATPTPSTPGAPSSSASPPASPSAAASQKSPPLPADNPAWDWDAGGFVPDVHWYGEASWDDVEMRAAQHLAFGMGDVARARAADGDLAGAQAGWEALALALDAVEVATDGPAGEILSLLRQDARANAALTQSLATGSPISPTGEGLRSLRLRYLALGQGTADPTLLADLAAAPLPDFDLDQWTDFEARHRLRVRLIGDYLNSRDPLSLDEPWGYFTPAEARRQRDLLTRATAALAKTTAPADVLVGAAPALDGPAWAWPGRLGAALRDPSQSPEFTVEELGALVTGDSLIDVAGWPGPKAIGSLERLGLDDPDWKATLTAALPGLNAALRQDPSAVVAQLRALVKQVDAMGHGSRFYNIKALRNAGIRQLVRVGRPDLARQLLADMQPLHNQDWAAPNRQGVLALIDGRLARLAGEKTDEAGIATTREFLARCAAAEAGRIAQDYPDDARRLPPAMGAPAGGPPQAGSPPPSGSPPGRPPGRPPPPPHRGNPQAPR